MEKVEKMNDDLMTARKSKDTLTKNLLLTIKGEYETALKGDAKEGNDTLETIVVKMVKNLKKMGTAEANAEIKILEGYLPKMLSEDATRDLVLGVMTNNGPLVEKRNIGALMGQVMKLGHKVDAKLVSTILNGELQDLNA